MAIDTTAADKAALAAQEALIAANNARDGAEVAWLDSVTRLSQIQEGRTKEDANRLKSKFIGAFGFQRWQKMIADSRA
jgi:hypothetical protein